ncbi:MAG: arabinofuranosidase catalytic domain-containing protein [Polyangiaceae bacterium]
MTFAACSSVSTPDPVGGSGNGSVGTSGTGNMAGATGTAGTGPVTGSCTNVAACGGSLPGSYTVGTSCLKLSGSLDLASAGLDPRSCSSATVSGDLTVTGSFTVNANGTYTDNTMTTGSSKVELAAGCLLISGTTINCQGAATAVQAGGLGLATCTDAPGGGCSCTSTVNQMGGLGTPWPTPATSGNDMLAGNSFSLTTDSGNTNYDYCVAGSGLTITPKSSTPMVITGSISLQKPTDSGSGGSGGSSGGSSGGTGGSPPTGGTGNGGTGVTAGAGGGATAGAGGGGPGSTTRTDGPCDVYAAGSAPCVAAYSTIRGLLKSYTGPLFQIRSGSSATNTGSGGKTQDILMLPDGYVDTASIDALCMGTVCTVAKLYDQSGNKNDMGPAKKGNTAGGATGALDDYESSATKGQVTAGGHKVYSLYMNKQEGYRVQAVGNKMPLGSAAQGLYEIADGTHYGTACCWDFGNVTTDPTKYGVMNTIFFGKAFWGNGAGTGPWMMADFEGGVWAGGAKVGDPGWGALNDAHPSNPADPALAVQFAMGVSNTSAGKWQLRAADVKTATALATAYDGNQPVKVNNLGGIVLGVGGDNSNNSWGTFYEGAIVAGAPTLATDNAVLKNVQAVGYTK